MDAKRFQNVFLLLSSFGDSVISRIRPHRPQRIDDLHRFLLLRVQQVRNKHRLLHGPLDIGWELEILEHLFNFVGKSIDDHRFEKNLRLRHSLHKDVRVTVQVKFAFLVFRVGFV